MKNLLLFLALVAGGTVAHGQRIHGYAKAKVNGQEAFQLNDSTEVYAVPTDKGYRVQKRVWVPNASISNGVIMPGSVLYNDKGVQIGQTLGADVPLAGAQPATERKLRKYQVGLIEGEVRSTHLQSGSWPEEALVELLNAKRSGPFWDAAKQFFKTYGFTEIAAVDLPEVLAEGGYKAFVLMRGDVAGSPRFRILVVMRGESAVQSLVLEGGPLELPKFKLTEAANYGTVMHAQKPTPETKEAIDELAYRYMPLTSN